jgi:hypothetical protein
MNTYTVIGSVGMAVTLMASSLMGQPVQHNTQTLTVSSSPEVSFERGSYEIVEMKYDRKTMLSDKELISILKQAGFKGDALAYAWAIVVKESTKRPMSLNRASNCYGLFQINMTGSMGPDRRKKYGLDSNEDLYNPLINAQIAYKMSNGGKNWSAWSTNKTALSIINDFPG